MSQRDTTPAEGILDRWHEEFSRDPEYVAEGMALAIAETVTRAMAEQRVTRTELARRLGVSPAFVSRTLNAPPNLTLQTIAAFAVALGLEPEVLLRPLEGVTASPGTQARDSRQPRLA